MNTDEHKDAEEQVASCTSTGLTQFGVGQYVVVSEHKAYYFVDTAGGVVSLGSSNIGHYTQIQNVSRD